MIRITIFLGLSADLGNGINLFFKFFAQVLWVFLGGRPKPPGTRPTSPLGPGPKPHPKLCLLC